MAGVAEQLVETGIDRFGTRDRPTALELSSSSEGCQQNPKIARSSSTSSSNYDVDLNPACSVDTSNAEQIERACPLDIGTPENNNTPRSTIKICEGQVEGFTGSSQDREELVDRFNRARLEGGLEPDQAYTNSLHGRSDKTKGHSEVQFSSKVIQEDDEVIEECGFTNNETKVAHDVVTKSTNDQESQDSESDLSDSDCSEESENQDSFSEESRPKSRISEDSRPKSRISEDSRPKSRSSEDSRPKSRSSEDSRPKSRLSRASSHVTTPGDTGISNPGEDSVSVSDKNIPESKSDENRDSRKKGLDEKNDGVSSHQDSSVRELNEQIQTVEKNSAEFKKTNTQCEPQRNENSLKTVNNTEETFSEVGKTESNNSCREAEERTPFLESLEYLTNTVGERSLIGKIENDTTDFENRVKVESSSLLNEGKDPVSEEEDFRSNHSLKESVSYNNTKRLAHNHNKSTEKADDNNSVTSKSNSLSGINNPSKLNEPRFQASIDSPCSPDQKENNSNELLTLEVLDRSDSIKEVKKIDEEDNISRTSEINVQADRGGGFVKEQNQASHLHSSEILDKTGYTDKNSVHIPTDSVPGAQEYNKEDVEFEKVNETGKEEPLNTSSVSSSFPTNDEVAEFKSPTGSFDEDNRLSTRLTPPNQDHYQNSTDKSTIFRDQDTVTASNSQKAVVIPFRVDLDENVEQNSSSDQGSFVEETNGLDSRSAAEYFSEDLESQRKATTSDGAKGYNFIGQNDNADGIEPTFEKSSDDYHHLQEPRGSVGSLRSDIRINIDNWDDRLSLNREETKSRASGVRSPSIKSSFVSEYSDDFLDDSYGSDFTSSPVRSLRSTRFDKASCASVYSGFESTRERAGTSRPKTEYTFLKSENDSSEDSDIDEELHLRYLREASERSSSLLVQKDGEMKEQNKRPARGRPKSGHHRHLGRQDGGTNDNEAIRASPDSANQNIRNNNNSQSDLRKISGTPLSENGSVDNVDNSVIKNNTIEGSNITRSSPTNINNQSGDTHSIESAHTTTTMAIDMNNTNAQQRKQQHKQQRDTGSFQGSDGDCLSNSVGGDSESRTFMTDDDRLTNKSGAESPSGTSGRDYEYDTSSFLSETRPSSASNKEEAMSIDSGGGTVVVGDSGGDDGDVVGGNNDGDSGSQISQEERDRLRRISKGLQQMQGTLQTMFQEAKNLMTDYKGRMYKHGLEEFTDDVPEFTKTLRSLSEAYGTCGAVTAGLSEQLKDVRTITDEMCGVISRNLQTLTPEAWVQKSSENNSEAALKEEREAKRKSQEARLARMRALSTQAMLEVQEAKETLSTAQLEASQAEMEAENAKDHLDIALKKMEDAKIAMEEKRKREEELKKKKEEEAKKKAEELKKKKEEEDRRIAEEAKKKGTSFVDEKKRAMEEKARLEAERKNPRNWPRYIYSVDESDFTPGVGVVIRCLEGTMSRDVLEVSLVDQLTAGLAVDCSEELVSNILCIQPVDPEQRFVFEEPMAIAIPHCAPRLHPGKEPVVKMKKANGKIVTLPCTELMFDDIKDLRFVEVRLQCFGTLAVFLRLKQETVTFNTRGGTIMSSVDSRVTVTNQPGAFKRNTSCTLKVQPVDPSIVADVKIKHPSECEHLLACSPIVSLHLPTQFTKALTFCVPCPPNPALRPKRPQTTANRLGSSTTPQSSAPPTKEKSEKSDDKHEGERPISALAFNWKKDEEVTKDEVHFLRQDGIGPWTVVDTVSVVPAKKRDVVTFDLEQVVTRFAVVRCKAGVTNGQVEKAFHCVIMAMTFKPIHLILRQKTAEPTDVLVTCAHPANIEGTIHALTAKGFDHGPRPSKEILVMEGQRLEVRFRGNVGPVDQASLRSAILFNSHIPFKVSFSVSELDKFAQKGFDSYRGFCQIFTKAKVRRAPESGDWASASLRSGFEWVEDDVMLAEHFIIIPKMEPDTPRPISTAPVLLTSEGVVTDELLHFLSSHLQASDWRRLAQILNVRRCRIQAILRQNVSREVTNTIYDILLTWSKRLPRSANRTEILSQALINIGRPDLAGELQSRDEDFRSAKSEKLRGPHLHKAFIQIAKHPLAVTQWKQLARYLGVSNSLIGHIEAGTNSLQQRCLRSLHSWEEQLGDEATVALLTSKLRECRYRKLAKEIEDGLSQ